MTITTAREIAEAFTGVARHSVTFAQVAEAYQVLAASNDVDDELLTERLYDAAADAGIEL